MPFVPVNFFLFFFFPLIVNLSLFTLPALMLDRLAAPSPSFSPSLSFMHSALSYSLQTKEVLGWPPCCCPFPLSGAPLHNTQTATIVSESWERSLSWGQCDQILETRCLYVVCISICSQRRGHAGIILPVVFLYSTVRRSWAGISCIIGFFHNESLLHSL